MRVGVSHSIVIRLVWRRQRQRLIVLYVTTTSTVMLLPYLQRYLDPSWRNAEKGYLLNSACFSRYTTVKIVKKVCTCSLHTLCVRVYCMHIPLRKHLEEKMFH